MDGDGAETAQSILADVDICQQLLTRYSRSSAAQHRHLCATAAATRSIIEASSLPLTPVSYFAAAITSLTNTEALDSHALGALTSFISIVLPLVARCEIKPHKAEEAIEVLTRTVDDCGGNLGTSGVRAAMKCVGVLVAEFCNLKDWDSVCLGFEWLLQFSLDKRPKVRKCAQDGLMAVLKSFQSSALFKKASKSIYSLLKDNIPADSAMSTPTIVGVCKAMRPEHQDVLHLLNVLKHAVPYLCPKFRMRMLLQLLKILNSQFAATRHVFDVMSAIFATSEAEVVLSNAEEIFRSLVSCISSGESSPVDSVLLAATLAKIALGKLHKLDTNKWTAYFPMVTESLAGLLNSESEVAIKISSILTELIDQHVDEKMISVVDCQELEDKTAQAAELKAIQTTCNAFYNMLNNSSQFLKEHFFSVIVCLFLKLGKVSGIFMKHILLKLADMMNSTTDASKIRHLEECFGSAVTAMGPERILALLPISINIKDYSCSNTWLLPILAKNVVGSSLQFFMEHIVPLAESFKMGSHKVKKSVIRQDLQAYSRSCWGLLPVFCHQPSDTHQSFGDLAKLLIPFIQKDSFMLEKIAMGLQVLVHENKIALGYIQGDVESMENEHAGTFNESSVDIKAKGCYSSETARKNIEALALCCEELLQALSSIFFESPPDSQKFLKAAIGCLVSICDASVTKHIFIASTEKFQLLEDIGDRGKGELNSEISVNEKEDRTDAKRCLILEYASCFAEGSDENLVNLLFLVIKRVVQASNKMGEMEAYQTLCRILEAHPWFCCSKFDAVMDLLTEMKSSANTVVLKFRFACLQTLLIHVLKRNIDEENTKAFLILNEIILTLKDADEEGRKTAYDTLHGVSSKLRSSSDSSSDGLYQKLITMISGYLSGSSPHIKSAVVSALSILVYSDPGLCNTMPDVFHSVMELLHSKSIEVIKAVLGFVKVLVSCLQPVDLQHFIHYIVDGILRWSSVSRHHFKAKIVVILEIMIRKCGTGAIKSAAPEKYKDFLQGVIANRRGNKSGSKEAGTKDTKPEPSDSPLKGHHKRKQVGFSTTSNEEEKSDRPWKTMKHGKAANVGSSNSDQSHLQKRKSTKLQSRGMPTSKGSKRNREKNGRHDSNGFKRDVKMLRGFVKKDGKSGGTKRS